MNTLTPIKQQKNPYQAPKPVADKPKAPIWADKFGEKYEMPEETKQAMAFDSTQASKDNNNAWNTWLQPKASPSQIEFKPETVQPVQPESKDEPTPKEIRQSLHDAEIKTVLLAADVLDTMQKSNEANDKGFTSFGRLEINPESENTQKIFEKEITAPPPEDPGQRYLFERVDKPQEFNGTSSSGKQEINLSRPVKLVDFGFFFNWAFGEVREPMGNVTKKAGSLFKSFFNSMKNLGKKEVFFNSKKPLTPEEQTTQTKQNQNKSSFFANLRYQISSSLGMDRRRNLKSQIEQTTKQAGFTNVSFEGVADQAGQIRDNVSFAAERGNAQKSAEQLNQEKQRKLSFMSKGKSKTGPGISFSSDKSHNFNNAAKLSG